MKTKLSLTILAGVLVLLGLPGVARAQCIGDEILIPDGRPREVTIPFNGTGTFVHGVFFRGAPGRSYSVEVYASFATSANFVSDIFLGGADDFSCPTADAAGVRNTADIEPRGVGSGRRFSFTATAPITGPINPFFVTRIRNTSTTTAQTVTMTVADTTLFSPRWSTFGSFYTSWGINNTTNASCSYSLKVVTSAGTTVATGTGSVAAGRTVFRDTRATDLNVAASQAGNVTLTHDCPPGGIQADGFMSNEGGTVFVTIPVVFGPRTAGQ